MPNYCDYDEKSTIRTNKSGITTRKVNLWKFPEEIYQMVKDRSCREMPIYDIYSDAITSLRRDYESGAHIDLLIPPYGARTQLWLLEKADDDMRYLEEELNGDHASVCYTAVTRYFEREKKIGSLKNGL